MANLQVHALVGEHGRLMATMLGRHDTGRPATNGPSVGLRPLDSQRHVTFEVPAQAADLAGHHLEWLFRTCP